MLRRFYQKEHIEAGCDEAGRGCYAGPVVAAAVILPPNFRHPLLNDSKQVSPGDRDTLRSYIEKKALAFAVGMCDHEEIDRINILQASFRAMHLALDQLTVRPRFLLIDGNRFTPYKEAAHPYNEVAHQCLVQGDARYASIAAASILAKTWRDEYMRKLHEEFPHYRWDSNKGYGTKDHREAILRHGLCKYHRRSFNIDPNAPPDPSSLDPNASHPIALDPNALDPFAPDPNAPNLNAFDLNTDDSIAPDLNAPDPNALDPFALDPNAPDLNAPPDPYQFEGLTTEQAQAEEFDIA